MGAKAVFDADFGKFIGELSKVDVKLRAFGPEVDKTSAKMQKLADSLNGNEIREQAGIAVAAISKLEGGVAALNAGELKRYGALIDAATDKIIRQGKEVPAAMAQVKAALDDARKPLVAMSEGVGVVEGRFSKLGGLATGAVAGIAAAITTQGLQAAKQFAEEIIQTAGDVADLAAKTGLTTTEVQKFGYVAQQTGSSIDTVSGAVSQLSNRLVEGGTGTIQAVDKLGLSFQELQRLRPGEAFERVTEAIKGIPDPMQQTQLAMELFGKSGAELLPAIKAGFSEMGAEAERLGLIIREEDIAALDDMGDAWDRMALQSKVAAAGVLADLTRVGSAIQKLIESFPGAGLIPWNRLGAGSIFAEGLSRFADYVDPPEKPAALAPPRLMASHLTASGTPAVVAELEAAKRALSALTDQQKASIRAAKELGQSNKDAALAAGTTENVVKLYEGITSGAKRATTEVKRLGQAQDQITERQNKLSGRNLLVDASQALRDFKSIGGVQKISDEQAGKLFSQLVDARVVAAKIQPDLVAGINAALSDLASSPSVRKQAADAGAKILLNIGAGLSNVKASDFGGALSIAPFESLIINAFGKGGRVQAAVTGVLGKALGADITYALQKGRDGLERLIPQNLLADTYALKKGLTDVGIPLSVINERFDRAVVKTDTWRQSLRNVTQAFANLSQISGGAFDGVTQSLGVVLGAADAATSAVQALGELFKSTKFADSAGGKALAGGLAGLAAGPQFAQLAGANDGKGAFLAGAVGGGVSGFAAGGPYGAVAGAAIGGISALLAQRAQEKALRAEMDRNRESLLANYESREDFIRQAGRVGLSESYIRSQILDNTNSAAAYTNAVNKLNAAFANESREAVALSKSLGAVAKVNGVLSLQQTRDLRNALTVSPSQSPFPGGRTGPGDGGRIAQPREGVAPIGSGDGLAIDGPKKEAAEAFLRQQGESLLAGLGKILEQPGALTPSLVRAVGQSLPAALAELERSGLSSIDALKTLQPLLEKFQEKAVLAGAGSTPGFDALNQQLALLKDERLGPLIERANGAGQALGALQNLGLLNAETFAGFTASITETVAGMDLLSTDGQNAMRLIRQPLQNIWQLQKDFGYEVDASTQALLDQAEAAGLIGEKFRPVEDRMLEGIDKIVDRLDKLIGVFTGEFPAAAIEGAQIASAGIRGEFDRLKPVVRVRYQVDDPPPIADPRVFYPEDPRRNEPPSTQPSEPTLPTPTEPGTRHPADSGFAAAQSATSSTQTAAVYIDGREAGYAILPHLGSILEFHDVR